MLPSPAAMHCAALATILLSSPGGGYNNVVLPQSTLINRNIMVAGRRTSMRLEPEMWAALLDIARRENSTIHAIATHVADRKKPETSLTAATRVFCLAYYRAALDNCE